MGNCGSSGAARSRLPQNASAQRPADPAEAAIGDGKPLQIEVWSSNPPLTKVDIDKKRKEFWDTAPEYEGSREIWQALKAACEADDTNLAQAILTASEIKLPNGSLTTCFDTTGTKYSIPNYCISYPSNMISESLQQPQQQPQHPSTGPSPAASPARSVSESSIGKISEEDGIKVKCRLSIGQDESYVFTLHDTMLEVKQKIMETQNIALERILIYFVGKLVPDRVPIGSLGLGKNDILQAMILPAAS